MVKRKALLGGFIGALVGVGLFVLAIYLSSLINEIWAFLVFTIVAWLLGGLIAGIIATSPKKGALAGLLVTAFTFLIYAIVIILVVVIGGLALLTALVAIFTLGQVETIDIPAGLMLALIGVGLLIAFILSLISGGFNVAAGAIGGLIRNPDKGQALDY